MAKATHNGNPGGTTSMATNTGPTTAGTYAAPVTGARHDDGH
jgi:hypothetical protein